jgi:hypothetical protein
MSLILGHNIEKTGECGYFVEWINTDGRSCNAFENKID